MIQNVPRHPSFLAYGFTFLFKAHGFIIISIIGVTHHVEPDDFLNRSSWSANLSSALLSSPLRCHVVAQCPVELTFPFLFIFFPASDSCRWLLSSCCDESADNHNRSSFGFTCVRVKNGKNKKKIRQKSASVEQDNGCFSFACCLLALKNGDGRKNVKL